MRSYSEGKATVRCLSTSASFRQRRQFIRETRPVSHHDSHVRPAPSRRRPSRGAARFQSSRAPDRPQLGRLLGLTPSPLDQVRRSYMLRIHPPEMPKTSSSGTDSATPLSGLLPCCKARSYRHHYRVRSIRPAWAARTGRNAWRMSSRKRGPNRPRGVCTVSKNHDRSAMS